MTIGVCGLNYEAKAQGEVSYSPIHAAEERGFGDWEVHPQKLPQLVNGSIELRANGDWLAHSISGVHIAFKPASGGRESAERLCALYNADKPTRIVDLSERESVSPHTHASVKAELDAKQAIAS